MADDSHRPVEFGRRGRKRTWTGFVRWQAQRLHALRDAPPWLISLIMHLIFLLVLAMISLRSNIGNDLLLTFRQGNDLFAPALVEFNLASIDIEPTHSMEPLSQDYQFTELIVPITLPTPSIRAAEMPAVSKVEAGSQSSNPASAASVSSMFGGRTGAMKQALLNSGGGTQETEDAVALGLAWLKRQQKSDGSWSMLGPYGQGGRSENATAATSMAMLAFMGAGNTHKDGEYKQVVSKAVRWLADQQDRNGFMAHLARGNEKMYAQAQATITLCELFAMTRDYWLHPYAQRACDFACQAQAPEGGWRYVPRFDSDTSVTGWFVMGLKSGQAAGLEISSSVFPKVEKYLDSVSSDYNAGYSYQVGKFPSPAMTAEGLLCRQYLG